MSQLNKKKPGGVKEFFRKKIVTLKRKPQMIPMLVLAVGFLFYSLNLTHVSDTTAKIQLSGMGLSGFCTMLFSMLSFVCFLNSYPHRKKTNIPMLVLMFLMLALLIVCDTFYMGQITKAYDMLNVHRIIIAVGAALTLLVPVLRKLLKKINTSLPVEEGMQMEEIMLTGDN